MDPRLKACTMHQRIFLDREQHKAQQMMPLSISNDDGLFDAVWGWHRRHSLELSLLQHICWNFGGLSVVWYFLTISFSSTSSSYSIFRQTLGVVGASGNKEIDKDFSNTSLAPTGVMLWLKLSDGDLSRWSEGLIEFSLSSSSSVVLDTSSLSCSSGLWHSVDSSRITFVVCTARTSLVCSSSASHLWLIHSDTSRRSLKWDNKFVWSINYSLITLLCRFMLLIEFDLQTKFHEKLEFSKSSALTFFSSHFTLNCSDANKKIANEIARIVKPRYVQSMTEKKLLWTRELIEAEPPEINHSARIIQTMFKLAVNGSLLVCCFWPRRDSFREIFVIID